jgi:hypothetical protein
VKRIISQIAAAALLALLIFPGSVYAASASFSISGPKTLSKGQTGTYTVKVTVSDAAAAQAKLVYDNSFFELVSGNLIGLWDTASNTSTTVTLTTVTLKCIAEQGSSGKLTLTDAKAGRFTGGDPPTETVSSSVGSLTVTNPVPTPTPTAGPTPTKKPTPTAGPTPTTGPSVAPTASPTPAVTASPSPQPSATPSVTAAPTPSPQPDPWQAVLQDLQAMPAGGQVSAEMDGGLPLPAAALTLLKEKQGVLLLDFGNATCRIDGSKLNAIPAGLQAIHLDPGTTRRGPLSQAANGHDLYQYHFAQSSEWPGPFTFTLAAPGSKPGDRLYLYAWHETAGILAGSQVLEVDGSGSVTFTLCGSGSYLASSQLVDGAINPFADPSGGAKAQTSGVPLPVLLICLAAAAVLAVLVMMYFCRTGIFRKKLGLSGGGPGSEPSSDR